MNVHAWAGQLTAPVAVVVGIGICFFGYRILKLTLGIMGLIGGATGGWGLGVSLAPSSNGIALVCAILGGIIGAFLCVWLFFLGIFLLGASAGAIVAAAVANAAGHPPQPVLLLVLGVGFGFIALVLQKFMMIFSTAFSGAYLATAGIFQFFEGVQNISPLWFEPLHPGSAGILRYAAVVCWLLIGLTGVSFQYRGSRRRYESAQRQPKPD